jgi:RNA polymerase sigma factor (sigma-70 family)
LSRGGQIHRLPDTYGLVDAQARFEALYSAHNAAVRTYVRRRVDADGADDVVADVFVIAWRRLTDVPDDALPWLLGVARRVLANRWRGASRELALRDRMAFDRPPSPPALGGPSDSSQEVLRALRALRQTDRETLLLVAWEGLTPAQAAKALGVSANTFSARLSRARRRFERELDAGSVRSDPQPRPVPGEVRR